MSERTPTHGDVWVHTRTGEGRVVLMVCGTGPEPMVSGHSLRGHGLPFAMSYDTFMARHRLLAVDPDESVTAVPKTDSPIRRANQQDGREHGNHGRQAEANEGDGEEAAEVPGLRNVASSLQSGTAPGEGASGEVGFVGCSPLVIPPDEEGAYLMPWSRACLAPDCDCDTRADCPASEPLR